MKTNMCSKIVVISLLIFLICQPRINAQTNMQETENHIKAKGHLPGKIQTQTT
jgi:hypothetical protein